MRPRATRKRLTRRRRRTARRGAGWFSKSSLTQQFLKTATIYNSKFKPVPVGRLESIPKWFNDPVVPRPSATREHPEAVEGTTLVAWFEVTRGGPHGETQYFVRDTKTGAEELMTTDRD